jgi:hypothetical protein
MFFSLTFRFTNVRINAKFLKDHSTDSFLAKILWLKLYPQAQGKQD